MAEGPNVYGLLAAIRSRMTYRQIDSTIAQLTCPICGSWGEGATEAGKNARIHKHLQMHEGAYTRAHTHGDPGGVADYWHALKVMAPVTGWTPVPQVVDAIYDSYSGPNAHTERLAAFWVARNWPALQKAGVSVPNTGRGLILLIPTPIWGLLVSLADSTDFRDHAAALVERMAEDQKAAP